MEGVFEEFKLLGRTPVGDVLGCLDSILATCCIPCTPLATLLYTVCDTAAARAVVLHCDINGFSAAGNGFPIGSMRTFLYTLKHTKASMYLIGSEQP
jgi:hypothetical protein